MFSDGMKKKLLSDKKEKWGVDYKWNDLSGSLGVEIKTDTY